MQATSGSRRRRELPVKAQIALTVAEGKRLVAKAVARLPEVEHARRHGKILFKGGSTVSAVAEELAKIPLRIRREPFGTGPVCGDNIA